MSAFKARQDQLLLPFKDRQEQLLLPFSKYEPLEFELYFSATNQVAVEHIVKLASADEYKNIFLWGEAGVGKSHLLQAACQHASGKELSSVYIPLNNLDEFIPAMLHNLESLDLICIDDVESIAKNAEWERAVFNLFNLLKQAQTPLLLASRYNPGASQIQLNDLKSRFAGDYIYHLTPLNDEEKKQALRLRANKRGFEIPDEVVDYLLKYIPRDTFNIFKWLDKLDNSTLVAQKKLSIPFVRELLSHIRE